MNDQNIEVISQTPQLENIFKTLLRADAIIQWKQRRALVMSLIIPIIFVISWKSLIPIIGAPSVLAICIAIGLPATGLMGYSQTIARDRERGVFQRLRTAPIPTWVIMTSRIIIQLGVIVLMTLVTYAVANWVDKITISVGSLLLVLLAALAGGLSFLALGQLVVALIKSSEAVNAAVRLIYFPLAIVGALGEVNLFGDVVKKIVTWSPLGTTKTLLVAAMEPSTINSHIFWVLLVTLGYGIVFAGLGIRWFKWAVN